jgi:acyl CoA:acetate/3-ketoacid CoA transferase alpha subunit
MEMNYTTTGEHIPEAEWNNRTLKERMHATMHRLPFKAMPKEMLRAMARTSCQQLNFFPAKTGVSSHYSPSS